MKPDKSFFKVVQLIQHARQKAYYSVNKQLIKLYWDIGKFINQKVSSEEYGRGVVEELSLYISKHIGDYTGFSTQNLWRMKQFYEVYYKNKVLSPLVRELSWSNNLHILSKTKSNEEKEFYIKLSVKERYSKRELERQIDSGLFERYMITQQKPSPVVRELKSKNLHIKKLSKPSPVVRELYNSPYNYVPKLNEVFKDMYIFEFLELPENFSEKDLRKALVNNIKKFILEVGKDFTFVGEEYPLQVGKKDFSIDLLLFHRVLKCLVVIDLKIEDFKPDHIGQMNFYLDAVDHKIKLPDENPTVGLLLVKSKDDEVVHFAMNKNLSPLMVAEYETKLINRKLLERKFHELSGYFDKAEKVREALISYGI